MIDNKIIEMYSNIIKFPKYKDIAKELGITYDSLKHRIKKLRENKLISEKRNETLNITDNIAVDNTIVNLAKSEVVRRDNIISQLRKELDTAYKLLHTDENITNIVYGINNVNFDTVPKWLDSNNTDTDVLVPCIMLGDVHLGSTIKSDEINYKNEFNTAIAIERVNTVVDDFISITTKKLSLFKYPGVVLFLMGDMIDGNLPHSYNEGDATQVEQVIDMVNLISQQINKLKAVFGKVTVFAVTGNHSRLSPHRPKTKGRVLDSLEAIAFIFLDNIFKEDKDISFIFNKSDEIYCTINNRRFCILHGDTLKGSSDAIAGPITGIMRGAIKKQSSGARSGTPFDTLLLGHYHTHWLTDSLIITNSIKGWDTFAKSINIPYSEPGTTMFMINNHGDIIFGTNIKCRDRQKQIVVNDKHITLF